LQGLKELVFPTAASIGKKPIHMSVKSGSRRSAAVDRKTASILYNHRHDRAPGFLRLDLLYMPLDEPSAWTDPDAGWFKLNVPATENPRVSKEFLERQRQDMGDR
jgi:hypothetical protein